MPTYQNTGKIDYRFLNQGGINFENLSTQALENIHSIITIVHSVETVNINVSTKFTDGNVSIGTPAKITLTDIDLSFVPNFSTSNPIAPSFKTTGFIDGNIEIDNALVEIYNSEGDMLRDLNGNFIYGKSVKDPNNPNVLVIELYRDINFTSPYTATLNDIDWGTGTFGIMKFIIPYRRNLFELQNILFRGKFQIGVIRPEITNDIINIRNYLGIIEGQNSVNFSTEPNSNILTATTLEGIVKQINANLIGNLNNLNTTNKLSIVGAINDILENGQNQIEYLKYKNVGGIISGGTLGGQGTSIISLNDTTKIWLVDINNQDKVITINPFTQNISDTDVFIWNGTNWVNPASDFTDKTFIAILYPQIQTNWKIIFVEALTNTYIEVPASWDWNILPLGLSKDEGISYKIGRVILTRNTGNYVINSITPRRGFLQKDLTLNINLLKEENTLTQVGYPLSHYSEWKQISDVKGYLQVIDTNLSGFSQFLKYVISILNDQNNNNIIKITKNEIIHSPDFSNRILKLEELNFDTLNNTSYILEQYQTLGIYKIIGFLRQINFVYNNQNYSFFEHIEPTGLIGYEVNVGGGNIGLFIDIANNNLYLKALYTQINLIDNTYTSFPFLSITHLAYVVANQVPKNFKQIAYTGSGGGIISPSTLLLYIPFDDTFNTADYISVSINGIEYLGSRTISDNHTAKIYVNNGSFAIDYPTGIVPNVSDRIIIKWWKIS